MTWLTGSREQERGSDKLRPVVPLQGSYASFPDPTSVVTTAARPRSIGRSCRAAALLKLLLSRSAR